MGESDEKKGTQPTQRGGVVITRRKIRREFELFFETRARPILSPSRWS